MRGTGRVVFTATLLLIAGTLNILYGIGALDGANIFTDDRRYILSDLNTLGWVLILLGVIQLIGGFSLMAGNAFGRFIGILGATLGAIGALLRDRTEQLASPIFLPERRVDDALRDGVRLPNVLAAPLAGAFVAVVDRAADLTRPDADALRPITPGTLGNWASGIAAEPA